MTPDQLRTQKAKIKSIFDLKADGQLTEEQFNNALLAVYLYGLQFDLEEEAQRLEALKEWS